MNNEHDEATMQYGRVVNAMLVALYHQLVLIDSIVEEGHPVTKAQSDARAAEFMKWFPIAGNAGASLACLDEIAEHVDAIMNLPALSHSLLWRSMFPLMEMRQSEITVFAEALSAYVQEHCEDEQIKSEMPALLLEAAGLVPALKGEVYPRGNVDTDETDNTKPTLH